MYDLFYNWLLPTSLAGALAVLVSLALGPALKKLRWRGRRAALASTFAFFLAPVGPLLALALAAQPAAPAVARPLAPVGEALGAAAETAQKAVTAANLPPLTAPLAQPPQLQPALAERLLAALPLVWLAGAALFAGWQLLRYRRFARGLRRLSSPAGEAAQKLWNGMCAGQGLAAAPALRCCPGLPGPVLTGLWRPVLYLPEGLRGEALELALRHERAHVSRADLWLKALVRLACRVHWFNPLCRWQAARLNRVCEYACDEQAVAGLSQAQRKAYGAVLLTAALPARLPAGASGFGSSQKLLKKRLEALFAPAGGGRRACAAAALALAAGLALTACAAAGFAGGAATIAASGGGSGGGSGSAKLLSQTGPGPAAAPWALPTPEPTATPAPAEAVPTPLPEPAEKPALLAGEAGVRWAHWQQPAPYEIEYRLDETLAAEEQRIERAGVTGTTEISGWEFLDQSGMRVRVQAESSVLLQLPVNELRRVGSLPQQAEDLPDSAGAMIWPVPGYKYVSRWMGASHKGADVCAARGADVCAMDNGLVVTAQFHNSYGNYVVLQHAGGLQTLYAHLEDLSVEEGSQVRQGEVIGHVGSTGNTTGVQCHVEVYVGGVRRSLQEWFPTQPLSTAGMEPLPTPTPEPAAPAPAAG